MSRKILTLFLTFVLLGNLCLTTQAARDSFVVNRTNYADGSYSVKMIIVESLVKEKDGTRYSTTGTAYEHYYNANNVLQFTVSVKGTFTYDCNNAWATSSQYGYHISNTSWSFVSGSASCSGATATATCTFHNTNGSNKTLSVSLTCSPLGVLS